MDALDQLLASEGVRPAAGATDASLAAVTEAIGVPLPEALVRLWRAADGLVIEPTDVEILGTAAVMKFLAAGSTGERGGHPAWLPFVDDHTSNYLCLALEAPLSPRVIDVPHDDGPSLIYRDLHSALSALLASLRAGEIFDLYRHEAGGDYDDANARRSPQDRADARALLAPPFDAVRWNFAIPLLDEQDLGEFARLLETDHFVRRDVRARLEKMASPGIRQLLAEDRARFIDFANAFGEAARAEGLKVGPLSDTTLRVGNHYAELESFFHLRNEPGAMDVAMARVKSWDAPARRRS